MSSPYDQLHDFSRQFCSDHTAVPIDGAGYDLAGVVVYHSTTQPLPQKGRIEVNVTTPGVADRFAWQVEITLKDKLHGEFIHLILQPDGSAAETYGKTVLPIHEARVIEILAALKVAATTAQLVHPPRTPKRPPQSPGHTNTKSSS